MHVFLESICKEVLVDLLHAELESEPSQVTGWPLSYRIRLTGHARTPSVEDDGPNFWIQ